ncbi:MAG: aldo/keto reductase [Eubacterium sp.]|nr:aldo/keto reductase [Eubacterium sp.]
MQYRYFKDNLRLSQLGFGAMRLPTLGDDAGYIDEAKAAACLTQAIEGGVNYIDTAWPYHKQASEPFIGKFLEENRLRDKIYLATKLPCWECRTPEDFAKYLDTQLDRLHTDHIDFYLLHALDAYRFSEIQKLGICEFLDQAKASGKIHYAGFSYHDLPENFLPILEAYPFDFVQIQLNYMDEDFQAGLAGLRAAHQRGCAVMIMEPLRGGQLASAKSGDLKALWEGFDTNLTPASLALKYLWDKAEVTCVLSGMGAPQEVAENLQSAHQFTVGGLTDADRRILQALRAFYRDRIQVDCTGCRYCTQCPKIIPIPSIFKYYNEAFMYGDTPTSRQRYQNNIMDDFKASQCIQCGLCEDHCPQQLPIRETLKKAHAFLSKTSQEVTEA